MSCEGVPVSSLDIFDMRSENYLVYVISHAQVQPGVTTPVTLMLRHPLHTTPKMKPSLATILVI